MSDFVLYVRQECRFCEKAKQLFESKGIEYSEKDVTHDVLLKREMIELSGGRVTTPQVFFKKRHIGGCEELYKLDSEVGLDKMSFSILNRKAV